LSHGSLLPWFASPHSNYPPIRRIRPLRCDRRHKVALFFAPRDPVTFLKNVIQSLSH
jgi:hypothetical protein